MVQKIVSSSRSVSDFARAIACDTPAVARFRPTSMNTKAIANVPIAGLSSSRASITNTKNEKSWSPAAWPIVQKIERSVWRFSLGS